MMRPEQELSIEIGHFNRVKVNNLDALEPSQY